MWLSKHASGIVDNDFDSISIPNCFYGLSNLETLKLNANNFQGVTSSAIENLTSIIEPDLSNDALEGQLPRSVGKLCNLKVLYLENNKFVGMISEAFESSIGVVSEVHFSNLTDLCELLAYDNSVTLSVSPDWVAAFQLLVVDLRSWTLGPTFPMWLRTQSDYYRMDLSSTGISDKMPIWFWNLSSDFLYMNVSHKQIYGEIPDLLHIQHSSMIYLGSNRFNRPLPRISSTVMELDISNNSFYGNISRLLCHSVDAPNSLTILHLGENLLSGKIHNCWMDWALLEVIKLGNNNLTGEIPSSMGTLLRI
ncbi:hypothetical protein FEM48_Zijuj03G0196100 [Ziziphus jujuba var. spinosa]|uniref:Receptor-like protein EIX2 n=1 Tax=Ziziphus jujuba var. spinosa TaxID=714518 RepID=A0A978VS81_ZIZJJ|nr:hypothetical protein FEM48_Zijuj03G0196100 [Ziziphus jujuba var. spinosa]